MRARPLLTMFWPDFPKVGYIDKAITFAAESYGTSDDDLRGAARAADDAVKCVAAEWAEWASDGDPCGAEVAYAKAAAVWVAYAGACAAWVTAHAHHSANAADEAAAASAAAWAGAADAKVGGREAMSRAARRDYQTLCEVACADGWTDTTNVDVALLGPLWPEGDPMWKGRVGC